MTTHEQAPCIACGAYSCPECDGCHETDCPASIYPCSFTELDEPHDMTDVEADADTLASAGHGTDEDYHFYGGDE